MHSSKIADMESFVQFKINNKQKSISHGRALQLKAKYQRDIDHDYKIVDTKQKQLQNMQYDAKKIKKQVWGHLLSLSHIVEKVEKERNEYVNQMRIMKQDRDQTVRDVQTAKNEMAKQEKQLSEKIEKTLQETRQHIEEKNNLIAVIEAENESWQCKITEKDPAVKQYYNKKFSEELLLEQIQKTKTKSEQIKQQLAVLKQKQQNANKRAMQILRNKEEQQKKQTDKKKQYITQFIDDLNQILSMQASSDDQISKNWQIIRLKQSLLDSHTVDEKSEANMIKQQKYKDIRDKILADGSPNLSINEKLVTKYQLQIKSLVSDLQAVKHEEKVLEKICQSLVEQENSRDKQLKNLTETIAKISQNLSKF